MSADSKKKKKWFWRFIFRSFLLLILVVGVGGWFLPQILAQTSLKDTLLDNFFAGAPGSVRMDNADLGWNKPISIRGFKIYDENQKVILSAEEVKTEKTLWELVQNSKQIGMVTINKPDGHLVVREDGTNIGDALTSKTQKANSKPFGWNDLPSVQLNINDGKLLVDDQISNEQYQVADLKVQFHRAASDNDPVKCNAAFAVDRIVKNENATKPASGKLAFEAQLEPPKADQSQTGTVDINAEEIPVALFKPTLQFLLPDLSINAIASAKSNLKVELSKAGVQIQGDAKFNAKNVVVQGKEWMGPYSIQSNTLKGTITFAASDKMDQTPYEFKVDFEKPVIHQLVAANATQPTPQKVVVWSDQSAQLSSKGIYALANDAIKLDEGQLISTGIQAKVVGSIEKLSTVMNSNLDGVLQTDPRYADNLVQSLVTDPEIKVSGIQISQFQIKGPLYVDPAKIKISKVEPKTGVPVKTVSQTSTKSIDSQLPAELSAQAVMGWKQAEAYGLSLTPGQFIAQLNQGVLQIMPSNVGIGQGQLLLSPRFHFLDSTPKISFPAGPALKQVRMNQSMTRQWLKYAAPLIADATSVEGVMSVDLAKAEMPMWDTSKLDAAGVITFHVARIGPGPKFQQITTMVNTIRQLSGKGGLIAALQPGASWIEMNDQKVQVVAQNGRVYHKDMIYNISGVEVATSGSTGMVDQTIDMTARIIVPEKMINDKPFLKNLMKDNLDIRITGTLQQPKIDGASLKGLTSKLIPSNKSGGAAEAATGLIFDLINRKRQKKNK